MQVNFVLQTIHFYLHFSFRSVFMLFIICVTGEYSRSYKTFRNEHKNLTEHKCKCKYAQL
jgi:hypothetical protein